VLAVENKLCPSPWRLPTQADAELVVADPAAQQVLVNEWGITGNFNANVGYYGEKSYWGSIYTKTVRDGDWMYCLDWNATQITISWHIKYDGKTVRCVMDQ
jgi:hypothetical protein